MKQIQDFERIGIPGRKDRFYDTGLMVLAYKYPIVLCAAINMPDFSCSGAAPLQENIPLQTLKSKADRKNGI